MILGPVIVLDKLGNCPRCGNTKGFCTVMQAIHPLTCIGTSIYLLSILELSIRVRGKLELNLVHQPLINKVSNNVNQTLIVNCDGKHSINHNNK